jgi:hypothetical protein
MALLLLCWLLKNPTQLIFSFNPEGVIDAFIARERHLSAHVVNIVY